MNPAARHRFLVSFILLSATAGLSVGVAKVTTSLFAVELLATPLQLGLIAGAQSLGVLIMGMPIGVLVDQFGPLRLFLTGSVLAGLLYLVTPLWPRPDLLALTAMLVSFCMPCRFVSLNAVFMQQLEHLGQAKAGWFRGSHTLGFFLVGPSLAVVLIGWAGFAGTYGLIAASFAVTLLLAPWAMRDYQQSTDKRRFGWQAVRSQFGLLRHDRPLRQAGLMEFCSQALLQYFNFFILVIALQSFQFSSGQAAALVSVQGATFVGALFLLGGLVDRLGGRQFYALSLSLVLAALLVLGLTQLGSLLWLGAALLGLGLGLMQTINIGRFAEAGGRLGRGRVAGVNAFVGPAGSLVGSLLGGVLGQYLGLQGLFLVFVPVFVAFVWHYVARPLIDRPDPEPSACLSNRGV